MHQSLKNVIIHAVFSWRHKDILSRKNWWKRGRPHPPRFYFVASRCGNLRIHFGLIFSASRLGCWNFLRSSNLRTTVEARIHDFMYQLMTPQIATINVYNVFFRFFFFFRFFTLFFRFFVYFFYWKSRILVVFKFARGEWCVKHEKKVSVAGKVGKPFKNFWCSGFLLTFLFFLF